MTSRSLSLYSPDINPDNEPKSESNAPPPIRFRHIALLVFGGIIVGSIFGVIASLAIYAFIHSKFVLSAIFGTCVNGAWIVGYLQLALKHQWTDLRTRFAPIGKKALVVSALAGVGIVGLIAAAAELLEWAGVKIDHIPTPDILPHNLLELPLAVLVIVVPGPPVRGAAISRLTARLAQTENQYLDRCPDLERDIFTPSCQPLLTRRCRLARHFTSPAAGAHCIGVDYSIPIPSTLFGDAWNDERNRLRHRHAWFCLK
jgi:hypothetical protein